MPSYPTPGVGGQVKLGSNVVGNITEWSGGPVMELADTTPFGASGSAQQQTATIQKWAVKFKGSTDGSDTNGQVTLHNGVGVKSTYSFYIDATHFWSGSGILEKINDAANAQKGVVTSEYSVSGSGLLSWN